MSELIPSEPRRFIGFARFFKTYINVWTIVPALLPIPLTEWQFIPVYRVQRTYLSVSNLVVPFCALLHPTVTFCLADFWQRGGHRMMLD